MSFFELDGGGKAKARKSTKSKAKTTKTKKTPTKKSSGKKKGGNFLGTVSELFAPAGWENFVTAAGLLALDRTDNFLRKSKDSKKQKGGADDIKGEEEMIGGARKRSSSRKQRGGSDGHHTIEDLDMRVGGSEEQEMTAQPDAMSQTGGAKKRSKPKTKPKSKPKSKGKARKHKGGGEPEGVNSLPVNQPITNPRNQLQRNYNKAKSNYDTSQTPENKIRLNDTQRALNAYNANLASRQQTQEQVEGRPLETSSNGVGNNSLTGTIFNSPNSNTATGLQQSFSNTPQNAGKKSSAKKSKSKAKSSTKKPKAKKSASKRK